MSTHSFWSETDACLALDEALSDTGLTLARRQELMQAVIALCVVSPCAFRRLVAYGKQSLLAGDLVRRAREASLVHPKGAAFRDWLDSQPDLRPKDQAPHPVLLTRSQQAAWEALDETASVYFSGQLRSERIQPRTSRLIAGPSGVGKSHLVRTYAKEKGYGFLLLTFGSWLPGGSRGEETTAERVLKFLSVNERCIIALDELDKINTGLRHEWAVSVQNDLFALLDRTWFHSQPSIKEEMRRKLSECCFLVGVGTWQELWAVKGGARAAIGFHKTAHREMPDAIRAAGVIPTELLNRFHHEILLLDPMKASDFAEICRAERLDAQAAELGLMLDYDAAEASGLGMRWVEALLLKIHLTRARSENEGATNLPLSL